MKNLVITGDSLSYNRYSYIDEPCDEAFKCFVGMGSWSFRIRKDFISSSYGFKYGDELDISEKTFKGLGEGEDEKNAFFGERVITAVPKDGKVHLKTESETGKIVIYFQHRFNNYCRFSISVDGKMIKECVDTYSNGYMHQGYDILPIVLECDKNIREHEILLSDFAYTEKEPYVTIAGVSSEEKYAYVTGQGSRTSKFLLYHFEERIAKYSPDILTLILGGNDILFFNKADYEKYLTEFFDRMADEFPACKLITITIPPQSKVLDNIRKIEIKDDEQLNEIIDEYNSVFEKISRKYGALCISTKELFNGVSPDEWRFDNVHITNKGNDMLYEAVSKKLRLLM